MQQVKFLICGGVRYKLISNDGEVWRLAWSYDIDSLNLHGFHYLDYWRRKGVIEGEEEKKGKGS